VKYVPCFPDYLSTIYPQTLIRKPRHHLSPEDSKFAAGVSQPPAQQPDTCVPQGIVGQIKFSECLVGPQGGRKILTSFGCEATAVQPVEDSGQSYIRHSWR
jgi:hypothetical protein